MMKKLPIIILLLLASSTASAATLSIPDSRRITWQGNVGVGYCSDATHIDRQTCEADSDTWTVGIPSDTWSNCTNEACLTLCCNNSSSCPSGCTDSGQTINATTIAAAITGADNNTIVRLPEKTITVAGSIFPYRSNVALKGAGMGKTIIQPTVAVSTLIATQDIGYYDLLGTLSSVEGCTGPSKGSTCVVVSDTDHISAGMYIVLSADDPAWMWARNNGTHKLRQIVLITGLTGSNATFTPPLVFDFTSNPVFGREKIGYGVNTTDLIGVEDLTIDGVNTTLDPAIILRDVSRYWLKNVEIKSFGAYAVQLNNTVMGTITGSYIHDTKQVASEGHGIYLYDNASGILVENNIFHNLWFSVMFTGGISGNVVAYNYHKDAITGGTAQQSMNYNHGPNPVMNLLEGQNMTAYENDGLHGSGTHATLFRNFISGVNSQYTWGGDLLRLCKGSYYHNVIGNVLGDGTVTFNLYDTGCLGTDIYSFGYPYMGNCEYSGKTGIGNNPDTGLPNSYTMHGIVGAADNLWIIDGSDHCTANGLATVGGAPNTTMKCCTGNNVGATCYTADPYTIPAIDPNVQSTLVRHRNWDKYNNAVRSCGDESEGCSLVTGDDLPNSLYLTSKPAWFGSLTYPPIDPSGPTVNDIPAKWAYDNAVGGIPQWPTEGGTTPTPFAIGISCSGCTVVQ